MINIPGMQYPTPEEIMKSPVDFRNDTLKAVLDWKSKYFKAWKDIDHGLRLEYLEKLVYDLAKVYKITITVEIYGEQYSYNPYFKKISFNGRYASIISTLHEFRHAINGPDETSACRWSVHLFKQCFPKQFAQLEFKPGSHLLVKKVATA
jgi:hypothetical protein